MKKKKPILIDIETSLSIVTTFSLRNDYIQPDAILQDWNMLSIAWKYLGKNKTYCETVKSSDVTDDRRITEILRDVLEDSSFVIGHNSNKFDLKKLNVRIAKHRLNPLPKLLTVDTYLAAKKHFYFTCNRLDYLAQFFNIGKKLPHSDQLWKRVLQGEKEAIEEMRMYNKHDVDPLLEGVYNRLLPYIDHPNVAAFYTDNRPRCRNCGSEKVIKRGTAITKEGTTYKQYQCKSCGKYMQNRECVYKTVLK